MDNQGNASSGTGVLAKKPAVLTGVIVVLLVIVLLGLAFSRYYKQKMNTLTQNHSITATTNRTLTPASTGGKTPTPGNTDISSALNNLQNIDNSVSSADQNMQNAASDGSTDYSSQDQEVQP